MTTAGAKARRAQPSTVTPLMPYERRSKPPLSRQAFLRRMLKHVGAAAGLVLVSVAGGMIGFHYFYEHERMDWAGAFMNASLFLGGLGPLDPPDTPGGRLFVGFFSLYSGLVFVFTVGVIAAPLLHRLLHVFHWDEKD